MIQGGTGRGEETLGAGGIMTTTYTTKAAVVGETACLVGGRGRRSNREVPPGGGMTSLRPVCLAWTRTKKRGEDRRNGGCGLMVGCFWIKLECVNEACHY